MNQGASIESIEAAYRDGYDRFLRAAAAILDNHAQAADAVQDAFAQAVRSRHSYRGDAPLEGWLWRIVLNATLAIRRSTPHELPLDEAAPIEPGFVLTDTDREIRRWIAALPERQRLAIFLRYFADLDYRSIADALQIEVGTVSATLAAAHTSLRLSMQEVQ